MPTPGPGAARRELLLAVYAQERTDERSYWTMTATLLLTALGAILVLQTLNNPREWGVWLAAPVIGVGLFSFHVYQSAVGSRRRNYMEALEVELSKGQAKLVIPTKIGKQVKLIEVRPIAYNRYTWSLTGNGPEAPQFLASVFFGLMIAVPILLAAVVDFTSVYRLYNSGHHGWATAAVAFSIVTFLGLLISFALLCSPKSMAMSWSTAPVVPGP